MALPDSGSVNGGTAGTMTRGGSGGSFVDANTTSPDVPFDSAPPEGGREKLGNAHPSPRHWSDSEW
jgi:hypothetical protein